MPDLGDLKKDVFFRLMDKAGRVFILVRYSENVRMGQRGFLVEEKEDGIVIVFNQRMNFIWDDSGIHTTLIFGASPEKCFIPEEDIVEIYSPELGVRFMVSAETGDRKKHDGAEAVRSEGNIIKVDFKKGR